MSLYKRVLKRPLDVLAAVALGAVTLPLTIPTAAAIKLTSRGPIFFTQKRLTQDEREFDIIKFRSMYVDTPSLPPYKLADPDAHITPVGKWIRKLSIDELPQVINVIKGDMSFVGPRPGAARNEEDLRQARRELGVFDIRPGITGWAQVNGRDVLAADPQQKAEYDAYYKDRISLLNDLKILLMTASTVLNGRGYVEGQTVSTKYDGRPKVLFLIHTLGGGGAERVLTDICRQLDPAEFDITVMTVVDTGIYKERLPEYVNYRSILPVPSFLKGAKQEDSGTLNAEASRATEVVAKLYAAAWRIVPARWVHELCIREEYDTEVAFLEGIATKIVAASPNPAARKVAWVHTDFATNHKSSQFFRSRATEMETYRAFDDVVFVSEQASAGFRQEVGALARSTVLRNPIETPEARHRATRDGLFRVCVVGRLKPVKGVDRLLAVKRDLEAEGVEFELVIVGDGAEMERLQARASTLHDVSFAGYQTDPHPYIADADLFLIPSRTEGFSTVMVEALALGTPVMSTRVSGSDVLPGELVIDNDEDAIRDALRDVIRDPARYAEVRACSAEAAERVAVENAQNLETLTSLLCPQTP